MKHRILFVLASLIFAIVAGLLFSGCGAGAHAVINGNVSDYVTNTEPKKNGFTVFFVKTDTTSAYCTNDQGRIDVMNYAREEEERVTMRYDTINAGDWDGDNGLGGGCDAERKGIQMYRLSAVCFAGYDNPLNDQFGLNCSWVVKPAAANRVQK
jgi:hypothetical protein